MKTTNKIDLICMFIKKILTEFILINFNLFFLDASKKIFLRYYICNKIFMDKIKNFGSENGLFFPCD